MEKILLLNPPGKHQYLRDQYCSSSTKADYYWPPVDLLVLSGILGSCFELGVLDAIVERVDNAYVLECIEHGGYEVVVALSSGASKQEDFALFKEIKRRFNIPLIVNAGFLRFDTGAYLTKYPFIDAVITDYTEPGIIDFLKGERIKSLRGISYLNNSGLLCDWNTEDADFSYPMPQHELFTLDKYYSPQVKQYPFSCVIVSSGCKYKCRFCANAKIKYRRRDLNNIIEELRYLKKIGINEVHFPDFTFTADREHCLGICRVMIKEDLGMSWDCLTRADCFDEELACIMKQAGCHTIQFGLESKNETVLKNMAKPMRNEVVRKAFSACRKLGIETLGFFIIGLPGENKQSIKDTVAFARELDCDYVSFSIFVPDFGSDIRDELIEQNPELKNVECFDRTKFPVLGNEFLSKDDIWGLRKKALKDFYFRPGYIWKRLKKMKSLTDLKSAVRIFGTLLRGC
ncbi:MAG: radical SAM protein [PVC group bacterium]|nr:radical SAM protein [PVC group bacterium]